MSYNSFFHVRLLCFPKWAWWGFGWVEERSSGLSEEGPPPGLPLSSACVKINSEFEIERRHSSRVCNSVTGVKYRYRWMSTIVVNTRPWIIMGFFHNQTGLCACETEVKPGIRIIRVIVFFVYWSDKSRANYQIVLELREVEHWSRSFLTSASTFSPSPDIRFQVFLRFVQTTGYGQKHGICPRGQIFESHGSHFLVLKTTRNCLVWNDKARTK